MIRSKRVKCYDLTGAERSVRPEEFERLKKAGYVKPSKKEEKKAPKTKEEKTSNTTK